MTDSTPANTFIPARAWWKSAIVYQIYPVSFFDSNGDGIGDLNGIRLKLDYLKRLGVDVLWLSPIYQSPLADMGYDISDYCQIDPRYGTLEDWDRLLSAVHERGMKLIMDLVANHTSDEHKWFVESRSSKDSAKRDWYVWRPPKVDSEGNKRPPNNWKSVFQGSAWEFDDSTQEYYLHLYAVKQPDLNWDNPTVRDAIWDTMRFWLDRGCDGFRMDVINHISKTDGLPDALVVDTSSPYQSAHAHYIDGPRVHEYIKEMNRRVLSHYDIMTVGETPVTHNPDELAAYVLPKNKELQMVFQFELTQIDALREPSGSVDHLMHRAWELREFKSIVEKWQVYKREEGYWNALYLENHDNPRSVSRFGDDSPEWRAASAKLLAILQVTQSGTLFVYQGEEIGMKNAPETWELSEYKDIASINLWKQVLETRRRISGKEDVDMSDVLNGLHRKARDHARTPMQWDSSDHAGFTSGTPWMRVNDDYAQSWNVAEQSNEANSVLAFWKKALATRKQFEDVLVYGDFKLLLPEHPHLFAYTRNLNGRSALILMNFSEGDVNFPSGVGEPHEMQLVLDNYPTAGDPLALRGYEGRVYTRSP